MALAKPAVGTASRNENRTKLPQLLELKYHAVRDADAELGNVGSINELFIGFQKYLYTRDKAA